MTNALAETLISNPARDQLLLVVRFDMPLSPKVML
jgi:hypothetical protein